MLKLVETGTPLISASKFCRDSGFSKVTLWRMCKKGWLAVINISGKNYLTAESLTEFKARAVAGEFSKPRRPKRRVSCERE